MTHKLSPTQLQELASFQSSKTAEAREIKSFKQNNKIEELIDKSLELSEGYKTLKTKGADSPVAVMKLAESILSGNDKSLSNLEKSFKLAEYSQPTFGGSDTTAFVGMVIQEVGTMVQKDSVLDLSFPDMNLPSSIITLDRMTGYSGIAPEADVDNIPLNTAQPLSAYVQTYKSGYWGSRLFLGASQIAFNRELGSSNLSDRGYLQRIAYNTENLARQAYTRKKKNLCDLIFKNGYTYNNTTVSSGIPSTNYLALSTPVGALQANGEVTYNTTDPTFNPLTTISNLLNHPILLKYRRFIKGILWNEADLQAIMNHPSVKATTNFFLANSQGRGLKVKINGMEKEILSYYAPSFNIPFFSDGDTYTVQGALGSQQTANSSYTDQATAATQFFVPRGSAFLVMDFQEDTSQRMLGAQYNTLNLADPNIENPTLGMFSGVFPRTLQNSERNGLDLVVTYAGAPAIFMQEAVFVITGLYS